MLLNLDRKTLKATVHTAECRTIPVPLGTPHKFVERMGRDGGWFRVESVDHASELTRSLLPKATALRCPRC